MDRLLRGPTSQYIVNHVFLPVKLPQSDDDGLASQQLLCQVVFQGIKSFSTRNNYKDWLLIEDMFFHLHDLHQQIDLKSRINAMSKMLEAQIGAKAGVLVLPVREQNACVIVRTRGDNTTFEAFRVDPPNDVIMGTTGRVIRHFPEKSIAIPNASLSTEFCHETASFLCHMDADVLEDAAASTKKAGQHVLEVRDTARSHYITELFMAIMAGQAGSHATEVKPITKHTRNNILWSNAYKPWRRSPLWLIMRVALQTTLQQLGYPSNVYKAFIVSFMADILSAGPCRQLPSDVLVCMQSKIANRLCKLQIEHDDLVLPIKATMEKNKKLLEDRWAEIRSQKQWVPENWKPSKLDVASATRLKLPNSRTYLTQRLYANDEQQDSVGFTPQENPRLFRSGQPIRDFDPAVLRPALEKDRSTALFDIEYFVVITIGKPNFPPQTFTSSALAECIDTYTEFAQAEYGDNPETRSIMILTVFILWVVLDKLVTSRLPLLLDYSPQVPRQLLESLMLIDAMHIRRYIEIQDYLSSRYAQSLSRASLPSVFDSFSGSNSFANRYFSASPDLRELKRRIESDALQAQTKKRSELSRKQEDQQSLLTRASKMEHRYTPAGRHKKCPKCQLSDQAEQMAIDVFEWPLPAQAVAAEAVVFEVNIPKDFQVWRVTTYDLLYGFCRRGLSKVDTKSSSKAERKLRDYDGLRAYISQGRLSHVSIASSTKSFGNSHYRSIKVRSASAGDVCVPNGLSFRLYDDHRNRWITPESFKECSFETFCVWQLPDQSRYSHLSYGVQNTTHAPNRTIASQSHAPVDIELHEHASFGLLRSGGCIQWLNIARELRAKILSFSQEEVRSLLQTAALQVGPVSEGKLSWHSLLTDVDFAQQFLHEVNQVFDAISDNWAHCIALETLVMLLLRLIASQSGLSQSKTVSEAILLLRRARNISYAWMADLQSKLSSQNTRTDNTRDLQRRICTTAALCRLTYQVSPDHLQALISSSDDVTVLVESHIRLHDYTPPGTTPVSLSHLLVRDRRFSSLMTGHYTHLIMAHTSGLDEAIRSVWGDYVSGPGGWELLTSPNNRWIKTTTPQKHNSVASQVHLNLHTGSLLIKGKPLGRLPDKIVQHPTYIRLLNQQTLDIVPSPIRGMDYATREAVSPSGYQLHFRLKQDNLIVQASKNAELHELIPHTVFRSGPTSACGDLPNAFIENYFHWLNLKGAPGRSSLIEFRPLFPESRWETSMSNWQLCLSGGPGVFMEAILRHGKTSSECLVDPHSLPFSIISKPLTPLESHTQHIHITHDASQSIPVILDLPRFKLSFALDGDTLRSRNIPEMSVDEDQDAGTFYGLHHQLVLRSSDKSHMSSNHTRCVLVPYGEPHFEQQGNHIFVGIKTEEMSTVRHFRYDINQQLNCLTGSTLLGELYRIHLHALTSHSLPDPLFGHTGTEEALMSLRSARCRSFQNLSDEEQAILITIATVNPSRSWYPKHLKAMETVTWGQLSPLSQHWAYSVVVDSILQYNTELSVFNPTPEEGPNTTPLPRESSLYIRALAQNCHLYRSEVYRLDYTECRDFIYISPTNSSSNGPSNRGTQSDHAYHMSKLVQGWSDQQNSLPDIWKSLLSASQTGNPISRVLAGFTPSYTKDKLSLHVSELWLPLYLECTKSTNHHQLRAQLAFTLPAMAYHKSDLALLSTFLAFATTPKLRHVQPPNWTEFDLTYGTSPVFESLTHLISQFQVGVESVQTGLRQQNGESTSNYWSRRRQEHEQKCLEESRSLARGLIMQWDQGPCSSRSHPSMPRIGIVHIDINSELKKQVTDHFLNWHRNKHFEQHIRQVQGTLVRRTSTSNLTWNAPSSVPNPQPASSMAQPRHPCLSLFDIASRRVIKADDDRKTPSEPNCLEPLPQVNTRTLQGGSRQSQLDDLLNYFTKHPDSLHQMYGTSLRVSRESLTCSQPGPTITEHCIGEVEGYLERCRVYQQLLFDDISLTLRPATGHEEFQYLGFQWPRSTVRALLRMFLRVQDQRDHIPNGLNERLRCFAESILLVQRAERLLHCLLANNTEDFYKELSNLPSFTEQDADWLAIQIDGNFLARPVQLQVAKAMIKPAHNANTVIQLNMGEGKSSVIVPLIACNLADGQRLARVIVLKPLAKSMFSLLVKRLSGLADRRICYLPFSRDIRMDSEQWASKLLRLYSNCLQEKGIIVAQPEHILSFRLMGIDLANPGEGSQNDMANTMLRAQRWLSSRCRDVLDESDEILDVKYQLIYTSGSQQSLQNHPSRWLVVQEVLRKVKDHALTLHNGSSLTNIEVENARQWEFPIIRILNRDAGADLIRKVARTMVNSEQFRLLSTDIRQSAFEYMTQTETSRHTLLRQTLSSDLWQTLLLFRGLFACGILQFALQEKRWRVNYGLDPRRTLLAVPYRAKDVPALRADFGHPDVAVILTCLSYQYGGLTREQFSLCFQLLMKMDDPEREYNAWTSNNSQVPLPLRQIIGVNMDDPDQQERLYHCLSRSQAIIDFYLSQVVFPREAKQFTKKLSTSAWDLAEKRPNPTTGFSGTNDNKDLLPMSISQQDPVGQSGTNARVIECLLRPENDHYLAVRRSDSQILSSQDYLDRLMEQSPTIRVLLDVGAQMLDKRSEEIASTWLKVSDDIEAVVFFSDDDQLNVMTRDHAIEPFELSYYSQKLDRCAIYLDDAHTRGTDLKLPKDYRAAVTLGPKLTKDRLVQGCMRMRKLGQGQAVMFFAPPEVDTSIRELADRGDAEQVRAIDVLRWAMHETCVSIRHNLPHWAQQGVDYSKRNKAWNSFLQDLGSTAGSLASSSSLLQLREAWEDADARSLEEMYGPRERGASAHPAFKDERLRERLRSLGFHAIEDVSVDEEQEREVNHEAEQEREVERPPPAKPAEHQLHPDVKDLIEYGIIRANSIAFTRILAPLAHLDGASLVSSAWSPNLWSTRDFATTVTSSFSGAADYQRPVNWLLTTKTHPKQVIAISPYEANELLPMIRRSKAVHLHMYAPRVNPAMSTFEDLRSFAIPALPNDWTPPSPSDMTQLNIWAGQLYFQNFDAYEVSRMVLGIVGQDPSEDANEWESDGFSLPQHRKGQMSTSCRFNHTPLPFLREVIALRQKGKSYQSTHVGKIFDRRTLSQKEFDKGAA